MILRWVICFWISLWSLAQTHCVWADGSIEHVIIISVDGLRPDALQQLGKKRAPNFFKLMDEGSFTLNARTDPFWTVTMPNHACMFTGRGVDGPLGHRYTNNFSSKGNIHKSNGSYVLSIFDIAKAHGLSTGFFASKLKFQVFINSYGQAQDESGISKIDVYHITDQKDEETLKRFLIQIQDQLPAVTFVHFFNPDRVGHAFGWNLTENSQYLQAVQVQDHYLGQIMRAVWGDPELSDSTIIFVTSDHGGNKWHHSDFRVYENYRIPVIIWGKGVARGGDLYKINSAIRENPGIRQISYEDSRQPIRNGDVANAALRALGLPVIPDSTIGNQYPLILTPVRKGNTKGE